MSVTTDGTSKILTIKDHEDHAEQQEDAIEVVSTPAKGERTESHLSAGLRALSSSKEAQNMEVKHVQLQIESICLSLIHRKRELATVFIANILTEVTETIQNTAVKFNIGFL